MSRSVAHMPDFQKHKWRSRFERSVLDAGAADSHETLGDRKAAAIGSMTGTVVELGPGTGANMRYFADGVHVVAIEPNPHMHERLNAEAEKYGVDLEIRSLRSESIDIDDGVADGVVGTLLLCGVEDPSSVIAEAHRVLKPGSTYFFLEHVHASDGSWMRRVQRLMKRPHEWLFNGCRIDQDSGSLLRAGPFDAVHFDEIDRGRGAAWCRHQIIGTATKAG